jgi:hypothetical protein
LLLLLSILSLLLLLLLLCLHWLWGCTLRRIAVPTAAAAAARGADRMRCNHSSNGMLSSI